ncbi:NHLP-related RiPP peptide [Pseudoxanthomonas sp. 10H]|uniref:NHLP-related RiPP peptide n=1 Tax=Pseudoxanthomonas sp. 10H TaxID=3242729 RepID=UPI003556C2FE
MSDPNQGAAPAPLAPEVADRLLDLLASDDDFRDLFARDPAAALVKAGYDPGAAEDLKLLHSRLKVGGLASKDAIASARDEIRSSLTSGLGMQPILLNIQSKGTRDA